MGLKVFGGVTVEKGGWVRTIVATSSQKKAADLVGVSLGCLRNYWSETFNEHELRTALARPGLVFKATRADDTQFTLVLPTVVEAHTEEDPYAGEH